MSGEFRKVKDISLFEGDVDRPLAKEMWDKYHINITDSRGVFWNYPGEGKVAFDSCDRLAEEIAEWRDTP